MNSLFLVLNSICFRRDSSDDHYIFSLTFKLNGFVRHVRIEHDQGRVPFALPFLQYNQLTEHFGSCDFKMDEI